MSEITTNAVATIERLADVIRTNDQSSPAELRYEDLFGQGAEYVFDGNRVIAHWRIGSNGVGRWRLHTLDPHLSLVVTPDLRVRNYHWKERTCVVRLIRFESVFDALKPLDEAVCDCAVNGHAWSPAQSDPGGAVAPYSWEWCLTCGAELVSFCEIGNVLTFPENANEITARTGGALPTLHGPVVLGTKPEQLRLP